MKLLQRLQTVRGWIPVPDRYGRPRLWRWILLDGDRIAVAGALLTFVFVSLLIIATLWSFEMALLLTEISTVENILNTFLSGIILLVSVVVSINSIFLSQDMVSVEQQRNRIEGVDQFWQQVNELSETGESPSDLQSFLEVVTVIIQRNVDQISETIDDLDDELQKDIPEYTETVIRTFDQIDWDNEAEAADFVLLWSTLQINYGHLLDESYALKSEFSEEYPESYESSLESLIETLQLFAVGREYFKTMYYTTEISKFSQVLLVVSLPSIIVTSSAILAISAGLLPDYWLFGLPPLHSFVAATFTVALVPYVVLTSFVLRLSTVARLTNAEGLASLR